MKMGHTKCDPALLNRFFDQEIRPEERAKVSEHLKDCSLCQKALQDNKYLSALFKAGLDKELSQANLDGLDQRVLSLIRRKRFSWWMKTKDLFVSKRFLIPATAMATIFVLFFSLARDPASVSGPSAIVKSLTGDLSSVMIIEEPKSRQTIIWFNETS